MIADDSRIGNLGVRGAGGKGEKNSLNRVREKASDLIQAMTRAEQEGENGTRGTWSVLYFVPGAI